MAIKKWDELQLSFNLDLDEAQADADERSISPEEARLISEAARQAFEGKKEDLPKWFRDYLGLIEKGWPWRVACYIAWASSPKTERKPETLLELATQVLGLTGPRVIYIWRKKYPSIDTVVAMMQAAPLWEHRRDVIEALVKIAKDPDYKGYHDRRLFLEMTGDYTPRSKLELAKSGAADDIKNKSDAELRQWIGEEDEEDPHPTSPADAGEESEVENAE